MTKIPKKPECVEWHYNYDSRGRIQDILLYGLLFIKVEGQGTINRMVGIRTKIK